MLIRRIAKLARRETETVPCSNGHALEDYSSNLTRSIHSYVMLFLFIFVFKKFCEFFITL